MPTRTVFTKEQLLAIAALADPRDLTNEETEKFAIIEVGEPAPAPSRKEADTTSSMYTRDGERGSGGRHERRGGGGSGSVSGNGNGNGNGSGGGGGGRNRDEESRGGGNGGNGGNGGRQHMYDRFAPPSRNYRNSGNRDAETFDEGYKYELEQKNAHLRQLNETIQREEKKGQAQVSETAQPAKSAAAAATSATATSSAQSTATTNELDKLLAGIVTGGGGANPDTSRRSRFFNSTDGATPPPPAAAAPTPAMPSGNAWGRGVNPFTTSSAAVSAPNTVSGPFTVAPSSMPGMASQDATHTAQPNNTGVHVMASHAAVPAPMGVPASAAPMTRAEDIERMLKLSSAKSTPSPAAPASAQALKPPAQGGIQASELESLLKQQAQRPAVASAMPVPRTQTPPQQPPTPPQQQVQQAQQQQPATAGMFTVNADAANMRGMPAGATLQQVQQLQFQQQQQYRLQQLQQYQQQQQQHQQQQQQRAQMAAMASQQGQGGMPMNAAAQSAVYAQMGYPQANAQYPVPMAAHLRQQQQAQQQGQARIATFPTNPQLAYQQMMHQSQQQQPQQRNNY